MGHSSGAIYVPFLFWTAAWATSWFVAVVVCWLLGSLSLLRGSGVPRVCLPSCGVVSIFAGGEWGAVRPGGAWGCGQAGGRVDWSASWASSQGSADLVCRCQEICLVFVSVAAGWNVIDLRGWHAFFPQTFCHFMDAFGGDVEYSGFSCGIGFGPLCLLVLVFCVVIGLHLMLG